MTKYQLETSLIGRFLSDEGALEKFVKRGDSDDFTDFNKFIYETMCNMYLNKETVDFVTTSREVSKTVISRFVNALELSHDVSESTDELIQNLIDVNDEEKHKENYDL